MLIKKQSKYSSQYTFKQIIFMFFYAFSFILFLKKADIAIEYMKIGLSLCAKTVIPSLFPSMVISELIIKSGLGRIIGNILGIPIAKLFKISRPASCAVIIGMLCGFPIGARTIVTLLENGDINKKEAERIMSFCNSPSLGFIIGAVGVSLYSNKKIGIILYLTTLTSTILIGLLQQRFFNNDPPCTYHKSEYLQSDTNIFTVAVINSSQGMISICGYVVFFSAITGCLSNILSYFTISKHLLSLIYGLFELSGGINMSSNIGITVYGLSLTAFIIGWSGLSVHFQIMSVCSGHNISLKRYFISKFFQAILNSLIIFILYGLFPSFFKSSSEIAVSLHVLDNKYIALILLFFIISIFYSYKKEM